MVKLSEELKLNFTNSNSLIREISDKKILFVIKGIPFSGEDMYCVCELFTKMIEKNTNLKLIFITDSGQTQFKWHCSLEISPLSRSTKHELYKIEMKSKSKWHLVRYTKSTAKTLSEPDFDKYHPIFDEFCIT